MLIRCEKCSTTYELDESLIPPGGAPVQCSRCEHVFRAYPPSRDDGRRGAETAPSTEPLPPGEAVPPSDRRPGLELVPPPADDLPDETSPEAGEGGVATFPDRRPDVSPPFAAAGAGAPPLAAPPPVQEHRPVEPPPRTPEAPLPAAPSRTPPPSTYKPPPGPVIPPGKPVRKVPNPELEGTETVSVAPVPRRGLTVDVGTRKRSKSSWAMWTAVGLLAFLVVAGTISWWQDSRAEKKAEAAAKAATTSRGPRAPSRERQDAMKLLLRDDAASVERAASLLDGAVRREPASAAHGDRALALALLSQQARDQAEREESRARAMDEERARVATSDAARAAELAAEAETARAEVEPLRERSQRLLSEARSELDAVPSELASDPSTVRGRAWVQLAAGDRGAAGATARGASADDPWVALAATLAALPESAGGEALLGAADRMEQLGAQHAGFVRPLLLAARIRAGAGDGERALQDLDAALKINPQHAEARRLRAEIAPSIPDAQGAAGEASPPAGGGAASGAPTRASPAVNDRSQRGNGAAPAQGR